MGKLIWNDLKRCLTLKRFWALVILSEALLIACVIDAKTTFLNYFVYTTEIHEFIVLVFNMIAGATAFICLYKRNFTLKSIELSETLGGKRFPIVLSKWISGVVIIFLQYAILAVSILLIGIIAGANSPAMHIKAIMLLVFYNMVAAMGSFGIAMISFFLIPFPLIPITVYGLFLWFYSLIIHYSTIRGLRAVIYTAAMEGYTDNMMGCINVKIIVIFLMYAFCSLVLSYGIFSKKKKEKKKFGNFKLLRRI